MRKILGLLLLSLAPQVSHADTAPFTLSQICLAGVATFYGRSIDIMKAQVLPEGEIRVTYNRPEDGRPFHSNAGITPRATIASTSLTKALMGRGGTERIWLINRHYIP